MRKNLFLLVSTLMILGACGYKGPLYLPKNQPAPANPGSNQFAPKPNLIESKIIADGTPESIIIESTAVESK